MKQPKVGIWAAVIVLAGLCVVAVLVFRSRPEPEEIAEPTPPVFEESVTDAPVEAAPVFDPEQHEAVLERLGPVHHARIAEARAALGALRRYEQESGEADPERAELIAEIARLKERLADRQVEMRAAVEADAEWQRLSAELEAAEFEMREKRAALQERVLALRAMERQDAEDVSDEDADASSSDTEAEEAEDPGDPGQEGLARDPWQEIPVLRMRSAIEEETAGFREAAAEVRERRQTLAEREAELMRESAAAGSAAQDMADLSAAVETNEARLRALFENDPDWAALHRAYQDADARRMNAQREVQRQIQSRMRHDIESARGADE